MTHPAELTKRHPLTLLEPSPILKGPPTNAEPLQGKMQTEKSQKLILDIQTQFFLNMLE
jgi:hypothetical protein